MQVQIERKMFLVKTGKDFEDYILQTKLIKPIAKVT